MSAPPRGPGSALLMVLGCCAAHAALALASPDSWLTPNLTLVGLVLAISRTPARWPVLAVAAACCSIVWAVRFPGAIAAGCLAAGWSVQRIAGQWDASDERVQGALVLALALLVTGGSLWLQGLWSLPVSGLAAAHVALTYGSFLVMRRLAGIVWRPAG